MKVPVSWLRDFIDTDATVNMIADGLTMVGLEVASVEEVTPGFDGVKVARVLAVKKHPLSDSHLVATAHYGEGSVEVVTTALNVKVGQTVALALPGATMSKGKVIEEMSFKGQVSQGMLCSANELLLGEEHGDLEGVLTLATGSPGDSVIEVLGWKDAVLDLDLTPNYAHCLSLLGVAQEVKASSGGRLRFRPRSPKEQGEPLEGLVSVSIEDPHLCSRYSARLFTGVKMAPSPEWMQFRLWAAGIRPISNIVDVTNYVMIESGQPLHAFDYETLKYPTVIVRAAKKGERLLTLDGQDRLLDESMLVIADPEGPIGLAGVMGGEDTGITANTRSVLLESAAFNPSVIGGTSRRLGLRSEASNRFEKGTDVAGTTMALDRAAVLLESMGSVKTAKGTVDEHPRPVCPKAITMRPQTVNEILGTAIKPGEMAGILRSLGFEVARSGRDYQVTVPTKRVDVSEEIDLVEEVARVHGYGKIPTTMLEGPSTAGRQTPARVMEDEARDLMVALGLTEVNTYSFVHPMVFDKMRLSPDDTKREALELSNPLREDQSIMRTLLLPNLLEVLEHNLKRNVEDVTVFELSRVYIPSGEFPTRLPEEPAMLALAGMGRLNARAWRNTGVQWDFYSMKGVLDALIARFGIKAQWEPSTHPSWSEGRQARLVLEGKTLGHVGEAHPLVCEAYGLKGPVSMGEIDFEMVKERADLGRRYQPLPRYPAIRRDVAVIVPIQMGAGEIHSAILQSAGDLLEDIVLFDVYTGAPVASGYRSLAYALTYRSKERTLLDAEVDEVHEGVRRVLLEKGLELR